LIVNDYQNWSHRSEKFKGSGFQAAMGVPLMSGVEVVGVIGLGYTEPGQTFTQGQLDMLVQFGELASIALDNARLYQQIHRHAEDLEQRVAERTQELDLQKRQLEIILQNVTDGVVLANVEGNILYVNPAWERLTGYTSDDAIGTTALLLRSDQTPMLTYQEIWRNINTGNTWHGIMRNKRKGEGLYDEDLTIIPVRDEQNTIQYFVGVERDVTETLKLQAQQARFVANAAHELRTPLANFTTRIYLMRIQPEDFRHHLDLLEQAAGHMTRLVEDLLDLSRFATGIIPIRQERIELEISISRVLDMLKPQAEIKNISMTRSLPAQMLPLQADPVRIQQVLTNLVANAVHYTPQGGHIQVSAVLDKTPQNKPSVLIHVQDDGIGIPPEHLPYIFQPFYRVNEERVGTGLGLSIAKEIIERHGGEISVTSSLGHGTRFTVKLPLSQAVG
ncbi:MAG: PAS domain S-box protein, partial [Anaerolineae bacterium]|nr:PAS domain S-box protein [Anaerolineae bacterium]